MLTVNMLLSVFFLPGVLAHYCGDEPVGLSITAPKNIEALSGSCLLIPCSFTTKPMTSDSDRTMSAVWMKGYLNFASNPNIVIFNSSKSVDSYALEMSGNLTENNCTTLFPDLNTSYADIFFFRIKMGLFKATACADPLNITVKDSPWSPSINIAVGELKENQSVTITCSALTPCPRSPPELTWNLQQDSHRQTEINTDGTFTTKIQENITLSDTHDGYNISCSARYAVKRGTKTAETEVTLSVSYTPKDTSASISPSGLVSAGSWVKLSCSSRAKPPPSFTWFRNSKHGAINVSVGQVYRLNMTNMKYIESHFCVATNIMGNQTSSWTHLKTKETGIQLLLGSFIASSICILPICLVFLVCFYKSKHQTPQQTQTQHDKEAALHETEEFHYEDMNFFKRQPEASLISVKDRGQQETMRGRIKVFDAGNGSVQAAESLEDIYIQMMKQ